MRTAEQIFFIDEGDGLPEIRVDVAGRLRIGGVSDPGKFSIQFPTATALVEFAARLFREAVKLETREMARVETATREVA